MCVSCKCNFCILDLYDEWLTLVLLCGRSQQTGQEG